jgi:DNA invertase Pin-like site-specific DNA recombinase
MQNAIVIARCSTNESRQDVTRQTEELTAKYGNQFNLQKTFAYYQSGTQNENTNEDMLNYAILNGIKFIIVSEISRISRKVVNVLQFIEKCNSEGISVIIDNYNLRTLNNDGTINTMVQMMLSIGASFAQMELQQTKTRLASGRAKYISDGGKLGRKAGSLKENKALLSEHSDITKFLKQGQSVRNIMKLTGKSSGTVQKIKKLIA